MTDLLEMIGKKLSLLVIISKDFPNFNSSISTHEFYIDCYASDHVGVYVKLFPNDNTGMFIIAREVIVEKKLLTRTKKVPQIEFNVFLPKYDEGDSSVGMDASYYDGFEGHDPDLTFTDALDASPKSFLALVELYITPKIEGFLEYESFKNISNLDEDEV